MEFTFLLYHGALNFSNLNDKMYIIIIVYYLYYECF